MNSLIIVFVAIVIVQSIILCFLWLFNHKREKILCLALVTFLALVYIGCVAANMVLTASGRLI